MKKATCKQLRGACETVITGSTPEEMGDNCKKHVMEQITAGDQAHKEAADSMMSMSKEEQHKWHADWKDKFNTLEDA